MLLTLERLKELRIVTEAIVNSKALGVANDIKIKQLGKAAKDKIESEIGEDLKSIIEGVNTIRDGHIETAKKEATDELVNAKFTKLMKEDEDILDLIKTERELWSNKIDFEFTPVKIRLKGHEDSNFSNEPSKIDYNGKEVTVNAYTAFLGLNEDGFITIENNE